MDRQKVYDTVKRHLLKQNRESLNAAGACMYRTPTGLKCAVGCLIADEHYNSDLEGGVDTPKLIGALNKSGWDVKSYGLRVGTDVRFLRDLQTIHDTSEPSLWSKNLQEFAKRNNLNP